MRSYLARFAFRGDEVFAPISGLSGGEKGRLTLAVVMRQQHNLLLLDEPTNHLDLDSREALEESLEAFPGSIVLVSHDRAFIDRLATRVLDLRAGRALLLPGNYTDTAQARTERRRSPEAVAPLAGGSVTAAVAPAGKPARALENREDREASRTTLRSGASLRSTSRRRRIRTLEEKVAALEGEIDRIETRLWEEGLTLGPVASRDLSREKTEKKQQLDRLVEEWAELSELESREAPSTRE